VKAGGWAEPNQPGRRRLQDDHWWLTEKGQGALSRDDLRRENAKAREARAKAPRGPRIIRNGEDDPCQSS